ncbi:DUF6915 family protein [Paraburkholderia atlantica]|uniref:DUF6915 family protein n=1 Tax=Paraburkholderia atlantica TaxID=2654982 RepID=UPI001607FD29|nr:hypothetical protein [Paraburkholderia atlantica]MBB5508112.1 hypothetical protein [Paraburkholderia atlantica]
MKPHLHARISVKTHGGKLEDYMAIHEFIDHSKSSLADVRHRAMLHSAWGIYLVGQVFGELMTNSDGKLVAVRDIAEEHVLQDLGFIPTMQDWLEKMPIEGWMSGTRKRRQVFDFNNED